MKDRYSLLTIPGVACSIRDIHAGRKKGSIRSFPSRSEFAETRRIKIDGARAAPPSLAPPNFTVPRVQE